jgi:hypothetical protein
MPIVEEIDELISVSHPPHDRTESVTAGIFKPNGETHVVGAREKRAGKYLTREDANRRRGRIGAGWCAEAAGDDDERAGKPSPNGG